MKERKIMSAEEYLRQITEADERVWKLETRVNNLRTLATDNAQYLNGPIGHGQTDYDKTGTLMAEICDAEQELAEARNADFRIREEVGRTICRIENTDAQDVIFMRYMKGMKWDEIAAEKIFSVQRVYQLRRIGIEEMGRVIFGFAKD